MGRAGRRCAECDLFTDRRSFAAPNHSNSDTRSSTTNRNAIDRAAVNCLTDSDGNCDATDCIAKSNANSNPDAAAEPITNIHPDGDRECNRNSASKPESNANGDRHNPSKSDANAAIDCNRATESISNGNIDAANHAKRDAVAVGNERFTNWLRRCERSANRSRVEASDDRRFQETDRRRSQPGQRCDAEFP